MRNENTERQHTYEQERASYHGAPNIAKMQKFNFGSAQAVR